MNKYNVIYQHGDEILSDFRVVADNLKEAKRIATADKKRWCMANGILTQVNRIRVNVKRIING